MIDVKNKEVKKLNTITRPVQSSLLLEERNIMMVYN